MESVLSITDEQRRRVAGMLPPLEEGGRELAEMLGLIGKNRLPGAGPTCPTHEIAKYRDPHGEWRCTKCRAGNKRLRS